VDQYRNAESKEQKREMETLIEQIKSSFRSDFNTNDPKLAKIYKLKGEVAVLHSQTDLFGLSKKEETARAKKTKEITTELHKLEGEIEELKSNKIYENAFEWRFEFPEVLNDQGDFVGFDVVIGNPPYVDAKKLASISSLLKENFKVYYSSSDLSSYFFELGINVLKTNGVFSFINTNKFFKTEYGKPLRAFISQFKINSIINFEQVPIFDEALVSSLIIVFEKNKNKNDFVFVEFDKEPSPNNNFESIVETRKSFLQADSINDESWSFSNQSESQIITKINTNSNKIKDIKSIDIKRGVTTGFDPAFIITNELKSKLNSDENIKPLVKGANIKKYYLTNSELNLIFTKRGFDINNNLPIKDHLFQYYEDLKPKNNNELRGRKPGSYQWHEIQDNIAYYKNFDKTKIVWPLTAANWGFALDKESHYLSSGGFMLISEDLNINYLLAILNSNLMKYLFSKIGVMTAGGAFTLKKATIDEFPIKEVLIEQQQPFIDKVEQILTLKKDNPAADTSVLEREIDVMVYALYGLTE
jgi:hypothetical protein